MGQVRIKNRFPETISHKVFETNSSFRVSCEMVHYGKSLISFFKDFFARTALLALNMSIQRLILLPGFGTIAN